MFYIKNALKLIKKFNGIWENVLEDWNLTIFVVKSTRINQIFYKIITIQLFYMQQMQLEYGEEKEMNKITITYLKIEKALKKYLLYAHIYFSLFFHNSQMQVLRWCKQVGLQQKASHHTGCTILTWLIFIMSCQVFRIINCIYHKK